MDRCVDCINVPHWASTTRNTLKSVVFVSEFLAKSQVVMLCYVCFPFVNDSSELVWVNNHTVDITVPSPVTWTSTTYVSDRNLISSPYKPFFRVRRKLVRQNGMLTISNPVLWTMVLSRTKTFFFFSSVHRSWFRFGVGRGFTSWTEWR